MRANPRLGVLALLAALFTAACQDGLDSVWRIDRARFETLMTDRSPEGALKRAWLANKMQAPLSAQGELLRYREQGRRDIERAAPAFFDDAGAQHLLIEYRARAGDLRGAADATCRFTEASETFAGHLACGDARRAAGQSKAALDSFRRAYAKAGSREEQFVAIGRVETASSAPAQDLEWVDASVMKDYHAAQQNVAIERQRQAELAHQQAQYRAYEESEKRRMEEQARVQMQIMRRQRGAQGGGGYDRHSCKAECRAEEFACQQSGANWGECSKQRSACNNWCWNRWR